MRWRVQKLSVSQTATSLTIKVTQAQTDPQPAKIHDLRSVGYTLEHVAAPGTTIGRRAGSVFARDANIPLPLSGNVVVAPPNTNAPGADGHASRRVWLLALLGRRPDASTSPCTSIRPAARDGARVHTSWCRASRRPTCRWDAGPLAERRAAARGDFTVNNVFAVPAVESRWKALTTPYAAAPVPERGGHGRDALVVGSGTRSRSTTRVTSKKKRTCASPAKLTQAGAASRLSRCGCAERRGVELQRAHARRATTASC
jgi:hypothetical protein